MSKETLAKLLREEIDALSRVAERLEDGSRLCYPDEYDCSQCLDETMKNLKRIKKLSKALHYPPAGEG